MTKRILLVDDDRSIRESLSKILRAENYEVVLGENGQHAIEKLLLQTICELLTEPMESRARRASNRVSRFRYVPCDNDQFREMLLKRHATPYPFPASKDG